MTMSIHNPAKYQRKYYEAKAAGICTACFKRVPEKGKLICPQCKTKKDDYLRRYRAKVLSTPEYKARNKENYHYYKALGVCTKCGKEPAFHKYTLCAYCLERERDKRWTYYHKKAQQADWMQSRRDIQKALRDKRIAAGICIYCGKRPGAPGHLHCDRCLARRRLRYAEKHPTNTERGRGLCYHCDNPALPGKRTCKRHYAIKLAVVYRIAKMKTEKQLIARAAFNAAFSIRWETAKRKNHAS